MRMTIHTIAICFVGGCLAGAVVLHLFGPQVRQLQHTPLIGPTLVRLVDAVDTYRGKPGSLALAVVLTILLQGLYATGIFLIAVAIFGLQADGTTPPPPSLLEHWVIVPLSNVAAAIPISPGGTGVFEGVLAEFYQNASDRGTQGQGTVVGLTFRFMTILIAIIGLYFHYHRPKSDQEIIEQEQHEAEEQP